jgi:hypothetical protein
MDLMDLIQATHMSHSLDRITGKIIKVASSNINEAVMSYFKALSSYWPGHKKDDHDPFLEYRVRHRSESRALPSHQPAHSTPVQYLSFFKRGISTINL